MTINKSGRLIRQGLPLMKGKVRTAARCARMSLVLRLFLTRPLNERKIFVLGREGEELAGNLLRLMLSIRRLYKDRYVFVAGVKGGGRERIREMLDAYGFSGTRLVETSSLRGLLEMETAAYLLTDVTFPSAFIPRKGQRILNTWHGTPYKRMGADTPSYRLAIDNMQRNFFMADLLLFPSPYCRNVMAGAYSLDGLYGGQMVRAGYPRNSIFFDAESRRQVRRRFGLTGKKVWAYLPTWHEGSGDGIDHLKILMDTFAYLNGQMAEDELLYVKIHNYYLSAMKDLRLSLKHIRPWPGDIETYEFLNASDVLVTDYSSVFFDFACTGRKIVRYTYDEAAYLSSRGLYDLPVPLPFPCVSDPSALLKELRSEKAYDDRAFREAYCPYDGPDCADTAAAWFIEGGVVLKALFPPADARPQASASASAPARLFPPADARPAILLYAGSVDDPAFLEDLGRLIAPFAENEDHPLFYLGINRRRQAARPEGLSTLPDCLKLIELRGEAFCSIGDLILLSLGRPSRHYLTIERQRALTGLHFDAVADLSDRSMEARLFEGIPGTFFETVNPPEIDAIADTLRHLLLKMKAESGEAPQG